MPTVTLRLLGDLAVEREGDTVALPPSKKTRALLAYLALTGRPHRRARLCELLWEGTHDPRAALRWSLSKLRGIVNDEAHERLTADRETVTFDVGDLAVDIREIGRRLADGAEGLPLDELRELAGMFRGELLEGLELGDFHEFSSWLVAQREDARALQLSVLRALREGLADRPGEALAYARTLARIDALDESAHIALVELSVKAGQLRAAEAHVDAARRLFRDLRSSVPRGLEETWRRLRTATSPSTSSPDPARVRAVSPNALTSTGRTPFVGRARELAELQSQLQAVVDEREARVVLVTGDPGIGKSRLASQLRANARHRGLTVVRGRAYEAEEGRPYGPWIDLLRSLPSNVLDEPRRRDLAPLLPELGTDDASDGAQDRMFDAVSDVLAAVCAGSPLVVTIDDVQWLDEASSVLLHYVVRHNRAQPVLFVLLVRGGEIPDNEPAMRMLRGLRRDQILEEVELTPLTADEVTTLARSVTPDLDVRRIAADSGGNPLFVLEVARAMSETDEDLPASLTAIVRDRVDRLGAAGADVLRWAALLGASFDVGLLGEVTSGDGGDLLDALEELERHALVRAADQPGRGPGTYAFSHDLVRRAVYGELSAPRRRLMHWRVAEALSRREDPDGSAATDVVHHATLAGDAALAVRACVDAGRRCLRVFASSQAAGFAQRGLRLVEELADPVRTRLSVELWEVMLSARRPREVEPVSARLEALGQRALDLDLPEHARLAFHLLSYLMWEEGQWRGAAQQMLHAARVARGSTDEAKVLAMAEAGRCLVLVERDLGQAEALALEADAISKRAAFDNSVVPDALGLLRLYQGRLDEAEALFVQGQAHGERTRDRHEEFRALEHRYFVAVQQDAPDRARAIADRLVALAGKLREGADEPYARVLSALLAHERSGAATDLDEALRDLRTADAKNRLAYALGRAAEIALTRDDVDQAEAWALEAERHARTMDLPSARARALATLLEIARRRGDDAAAAERARGLAALAGGMLAWDVRRRVDAVLQGDNH